MSSPSTEAPEPASTLAIQRQLVVLRCLGYVGVQLNAILGPLLVFKLSGSAVYAGLALLFEWLPKLGLYLVGGSLAQRFGRSATHMTLEVLRVLALGGLALSAGNLGGLWLVAACAAAYQCCNALSNILFEGSVTQWWAPSRRALGHTLMLRADQLGCLVALLLGLAIADLWLLAGMGLLLQTGVALGVIRLRGRLHLTEVSALGTTSSLGVQLARDAKAVRVGPLLRIAAASALIGIPSALVFSALAFLMERAQPGAAAQTQLLSTLLLVRTGLALVALQYVQGQLRRGPRERTLAKQGLVLMGVSALACVLPLPLVALGVVVALLGATGSFYLPLLRHIRQERIVAHVEPSARSGVTGILISVEAAAYLAAALLLALGGESLEFIIAASVVLAAMGAFLVLAPGPKEQVTA
jgi:hypothetical protein